MDDTDTRNRWRRHLTATLSLGLPLIGAQLAQVAINTTDTLMVGRLGAAPLAAGVLGSQAFFIAFIIGLGVAYAVMPLAARAAAADDARGVRRAVRMGLWAVILVISLLMPVLWQTKHLLVWAGQDPELSAAAQDYVRIAQWALYPAVGLMVLRSFLAALERAAIVLWVGLTGVAVNAFLNWIFIYGNLGAPALGLEGAAWASLGTSALSFLLLVAHIRRTPELRAYEIFVRFWRADWAALRTLFRVGWPISATLLAEVGLFAGSSLLMGLLGTVALAAHGIALQLASIVFMIPLALASVATVRVGRAVGRKDPLGVTRAAVMVMALSVGFAALAALAFWVIPAPLAALFLDLRMEDAAEIVAYAAVLLLVAAVFQVLDAMQVISAGLLRGLEDTRAPMLIAVVSYWGIGMPAAWALAFPGGLGGTGVWAGLAIGLSLAAVLLTWRFLARERLGLVRLG